jgi:FkbM family methyltransferase
MTYCDDTKLFKALSTIGTDETLRAKFVSACRETERRLHYENASIRDEITGPILDALHSNVGLMRKRLSSGVIFDFQYKSKIARDFVMSTPETPDHVWEPQTTKLLLYLSSTAKHVVIGGAYFGEQAVLVAKQLETNRGICHAFEPDPEQSRILKHNAELNNLPNLTVQQLGLWNEDNAELILTGQDAYGSPSVNLSADGQEPIFKTTTIDTYVRRNSIDSLDLIMLDIEGGELKALQGAENQLRSKKGLPNIVFEIHRKYVDWTNGLCNTEILRYLSSFGYQSFAIRDFQSNVDMHDMPIELIDPESVYLEGPPHGFNMLAVKDKSILLPELFRFCRDVSPKLLLHKEPKLHHPLDGLKLQKGAAYPT